MNILIRNKTSAVAAAVLAFTGTNCFAAGDDGSAVTLADLTAKGPSIATEFTGDKLKHDQLANFAWREFIALSSPAGSLPAMRGKPNPSSSFVTSGNSAFYSGGKKSGKLGTNLLVWETFAHRSELFPHYITPPSPTLPFARTPNYVFAPMSGGKAPSFGSGVLQLYNNLDEASQIGQNIIFFPRNPPNAAKNPYDDSQLLFEAKVNQIEYDYGQTLSASSSTNLKNNSVEVKAAWRLMTPGLDASRYHTADAVYYTGSEEAPVAKNGTFGLVGLHIIQKTANFPTFIFATFEQVDALTQPNGKPTGLYYITDYTSLGYDPKAGNQPVAIINNGSGTLVNHTLPAANANLPAAKGLPSGHAGPIRVSQPPTITTAVDAVNTNVQSLMAGSTLFKNSVWKYYRLKGVQAIPTNEQDPSKAASAETLDYYLANITIESSQPGVQLFKGGVVGPADAALKAPTDFINNRESDNYVPVKGHAAVNASNVTLSNKSKVIMGGCMGCHGQAQQAGVDFSFLFFSKGGAGFSADTLGELPPAAMMKRAQKYHIPSK